MPVDPTFETNSFNRPKVLTEKESYVRSVLMLLFGKPGFFPSIPQLGIDIQRYMYLREDEINVDEIKTLLSSQCRDFLPDLRDGTFDVLVTTYKGQLYLLFVLPTVDDKPERRLVLGITTDKDGNISYNYVEN